jgi:hypothetical protein
MREALFTIVATMLATIVLIGAFWGANAATSLHTDKTTRLADIAQLEQGQARFHESVSGGGNIDELMSLWADDATFTSGGTTYTRLAEIRANFLNSGGFTHNWVSMSPAFRSGFQVRGTTADVYFDCHMVDWQANPQIVVTHGTFEGTARTVHGHWLFWHITAGTNPLMP